jgi:hypothetical protein
MPLEGHLKPSIRRLFEGLGGRHLGDLSCRQHELPGTMKGAALRKVLPLWHVHFANWDYSEAEISLDRLQGKRGGVAFRKDPGASLAVSPCLSMGYVALLGQRPRKI